MSTQLAGRSRTLKRRINSGRPEKLTVGQYLLKRLSSIGVSHLFLQPGSYLEHLEELIDRHPKINLIVNPSLISCGYMADGFGKVKGVASLATEVRGGELLDILMRANYESVPLVVIIGKKLEEDFASGEDKSFLEKLFRQFSAGWTELTDPELAAKKIDRVLDLALYLKKPVVIELPQEVVDRLIPQHVMRETEFAGSDTDTLEEALLDLECAIKHAKHPLIYIDRDVLAHQAEDLLLHFAEMWHIPVTCSQLAKTYSIESHPNCLGSLTLELARRSDLLLLFGYVESPIFESETQVLVSNTSVLIDHHRYPNLFLKEVILALASIDPPKRHKIWQTRETPETLRNDIYLVSADAILIEKMAKCLSGDLITSCYSPSPSYTLAAAIGVARARPFKRTIAILDQRELEASLNELYIIDREAIPLIIFVDGDASSCATHFPSLRLMEATRKGILHAINCPGTILLELK